MPSLRDIRKHINAIKSIEQITYAMKMVASARIKRAQSQLLSFKPYVLLLEEVISTLRGEMSEDDFKATPSYRFFSREETGKVGAVVISGDKGLCGSFNMQILLKALNFIRSNSDKEIYVIPVGRKSVEMFKKIRDVSIQYQMSGIFPKVSYSHAVLLSSEIIKMYDKYDLDRVVVIYGEYKNMVVQNIKESTFLPLAHTFKKDDEKRLIDYFLYEPDKNTILENLINRYINIEVYRFLLETQVSELAARMNAMELANKNAKEVMDDLILNLNKIRQAQITTEITEIISGANAVNQ